MAICRGGLFDGLKLVTARDRRLCVEGGGVVEKSQAIEPDPLDIPIILAPFALSASRAGPEDYVGPTRVSGDRNVRSLRQVAPASLAGFVDHHRAGLEGPCAATEPHNYAPAGDTRPYQGKAGWHRSLAEEPLALSYNHRKRDQPLFVDEFALDQRLGQFPAAMYLHLARKPLLELGHCLVHIPHMGSAAPIERRPGP